jgi:tetratricopeptide (TPR) repeat protein
MHLRKHLSSYVIAIVISVMPLLSCAGSGTWQESFELGSQQIKEGKFQAAETSLKEAFRGAEATKQPDAKVEPILSGLFQALMQQEKYPEAQTAAERILAIDKKLYGSDSPQYAAMLGSFGIVLMHIKDFPHAEESMKNSIAIYEKALRPSDRYALATPYVDLALLYKTEGKNDAAERAFATSVDLAEHAGGNSPALLKVIETHFGNFCLAQQKYAQAETLLQKAVDAWDAQSESAKGEDFASLLNSLGVCKYKQGKLTDAEPIYRRGLSALGNVADSDSKATLLTNLATDYRDQGKYDKAEQYYKQGIGMKETLFGPNSPNLITPLERYAALLEKTGRAAEAGTVEKRIASLKHAN